MAETAANGNDLIVATLVTGAVHDEDSAPSDDGVVAQPVTPKAKAVRKPRAKKIPVKAESDADEEATPATGSTSKLSTGKKRAADIDGDTPTKKPKTTKPRTPKEPKAPKVAKEPKAAKTTPKGKVAGAGFPTCLAEFDAGDRLIFDLKNQKQDWGSIEKAWKELTGKTPGKDVLRKRHYKLAAVAQDFKTGDGFKIAEAKKAVDDEISASVKKLHLEIWTRIAARMVENGADSYKAGAIEKKWELMVKNSEVDGEGKYIGTDIATPEDSSEETSEAVKKEDGTGIGAEVNGNDDSVDDEDVEEDEDA